MRFFGKTIIAALSTLIFSLSLALLEYIPLEEQQADVGYSPYGSLVIIYFIYSFPIYLIGGSVYSYFADVFVNKVQFPSQLLKYIISFFVYMAGGILIVGLLLLIILLVEGDIAGLLISKFFIVGALASLLYFHISLILNKTLKIIAR